MNSFYGRVICKDTTEEYKIKSEVCAGREDDERVLD